MIKDKERVILHYIDSQGGGVTPNEIVEKTGISYVTVKKYLKGLVEEDILEVEGCGEEKKTTTRGKTKRYYINYGLIYGFDKRKRVRKKID